MNRRFFAAAALGLPAAVAAIPRANQPGSFVTFHLASGLPLAIRPEEIIAFFPASNAGPNETSYLELSYRGNFIVSETVEEIARILGVR